MTAGTVGSVHDRLHHLGWRANQATVLEAPSCDPGNVSDCLNHLGGSMGT